MHSPLKKIAALRLGEGWHFLFIDGGFGPQFSITRPGRGVDATPLPGVSKLSVVALCQKDQSIALDEYLLAIGGIFFTLGQHLT